MDANPGLKDKLLGKTTGAIGPDGKELNKTDAIDLDKIKKMMDTTPTNDGFASKNLAEFNCKESTSKC